MIDAPFSPRHCEQRRTKQSRIVPRRDTGLLCCVRNGRRTWHQCRFHFALFISRYAFASSRRIRPSFADRLAPSGKGRREGREPAAPMAACAQDVLRVSTGGKPQGSRDIPAFPARWLYGLCRALPGERCTLAPVALRIPTKAWRTAFRAPGPHDFAVRRTAPVVHARQSSRVRRSPCVHRRPARVS